MNANRTITKEWFLVISMAALVAAMSFRYIPVRTGLTIHINNYVGDRLLALDTATYRNELGQSFTVTNFKYYISGIKLKDKNGKERYVHEGYYLIKQDDDASHMIQLDYVPEGEYTDMEFTLGVDSLHNCSGAQSGALDPANGMFWAWNTGYIFLKLEGKAPESRSPGRIFEYHIGGYKAPANCIRDIKLSMASKPLLIGTDKNPHMYIRADVQEVLRTPTTIDFTKLSSVTDFHQAPVIADNYKDMFRIFGIRYER
jgi:hypothetical protein